MSTRAEETGSPQFQAINERAPVLRLYEATVERRIPLENNEYELEPWKSFHERASVHPCNDAPHSSHFFRDIVPPMGLRLQNDSVKRAAPMRRW